MLVESFSGRIEALSYCIFTFVAMYPMNMVIRATTTRIEIRFRRMALTRKFHTGFAFIRGAKVREKILLLHPEMKPVL